MSPDATPEQPADFGNITLKELDRDLLNLHLPEIDIVATEEECAAMYRPGEYEQMQKRIRDSLAD